MGVDKRFSGRHPEPLDDETDMLVRAAIRLLDRALQGRVIVVIGCDADGAEWIVPSAGVPAKLLREALQQDFAFTLAQYGEAHL